MIKQSELWNEGSCTHAVSEAAAAAAAVTVDFGGLVTTRVCSLQALRLCCSHVIERIMV